MTALLSNAFVVDEDAMKLSYKMRSALINTAGKLLPLSKKAGAGHFEHMVGLARAAKGVGEALQNEDRKPVEQLHQ